MNINKRILYGAIFFLGFSGLSLASNPSFDCNRAATKIEKAICSYDELGKLDRDMSVKYSSLKSLLDEVDRERLVASQKIWVRGRNLVCRYNLNSCLTDLYKKRISYFDLRLSGKRDDLIAKYDTYRMDDYFPQWKEGKLIFSGYNEGGTNFNIVGLDPVSATEKIIVKDRHGAQMIAENKDYLIIKEKKRNLHPLVIIRKRDGKELNRIKLRSTINWGEIEGDHLIIVQGTTRSGEVTFLNLPTLKVIGSRPIAGFSNIKKWNKNHITIGKQIHIYDSGFNEIAISDELPIRHPTKNMVCIGGRLRIYNNKLIVATFCGDIRIYDLPSLKLEGLIPSFATRITITVITD